MQVEEKADGGSALGMPIIFVRLSCMISSCLLTGQFLVALHVWEQHWLLKLLAATLEACDSLTFMGAVMLIHAPAAQA